MKDDGIFDRCGLIDSLQTLLGDVEIRGRRNAQLLLLVAQGLDTLKDGLRREKEKWTEEKRTEEEETEG